MWLEDRVRHLGLYPAENKEVALCLDKPRLCLITQRSSTGAGNVPRVNKADDISSILYVQDK